MTVEWRFSRFYERDLSIRESQNHEFIEIHEFTNDILSFHEFTNRKKPIPAFTNNVAGGLP